MKRPILTIILAAMLLFVGGSQLATAQSGNQWRVDFWPNPDWAGAPVYTQWTNFADYNWGEWSPGPNLPSQNYSARFDTDAFFYAGLYRFTVLADDEVRLTINSVTYLDTIGRPQPGKTFVVDIPMGQGMSHVSVDFRQWSGPGYIHVNWQYLKQNGGGTATQLPDMIPVPSQPPVVSAPSLSNKYGDFTPCIEQGMHQSNCFHGSGEWNSPNLGSIEMEPKIIIWQICQADRDKLQVYGDRQDARPTRCSKTEAGWFPS